MCLRRWSSSEAGNATPCQRRYATLFVLLAVLAVTGFVSAVLVGRLAPAVGLGWFGPVEALICLTSPDMDTMPNKRRSVGPADRVATPLGALVAYRPHELLAVVGALIAPGTGRGRPSPIRASHFGIHIRTAHPIQRASQVHGLPDNAPRPERGAAHRPPG